MSGPPAYPAVTGTPVEVMYAALTRAAERRPRVTSKDVWERHHALLAAIDEMLAAVAAGKAGDDVGTKPRWLDGVMARELDTLAQESWGLDRFVRVRLVQRLGLVDLEPDDTYVLAMISGLGPDKAEKLRDDPDLVERALWRVFEVEGGGQVSLTNVDRFFGEEWRRAVLELVVDGPLDRARVLTECLRALGRDFAAYRAGWYAATYLALDPSVEETASPQPDLRRLLASDVPATVAFALKQLVGVQKAGLLDVAATLDALPPATLAKAKGTALAALALARAGLADAGRADAGRAEHQGAVGVVARTALGHPHADVQRAAAALLAELGETEAVRAAAEDLTPAVRQDLGLQLQAGSHQDDAPAGDLAPVQPLAPAPEPVAAHELAERTAALLEDASDVGELEAVLARLAEGGGEVTLAPLARRAKAVVVRGGRTDFGPAWLPGQVARVVLDVLGDPARPADPRHPVQRFVVGRLRELRESTAPLLATPDLPGGWVSPAAFVERLARNPRPRHHDLVAALLRLHPDGRDEAARAAGRVGELPAAVLFALDGVPPAGERSGPAAWWIAAERSRTPYPDTEAPRLSGVIETHTWKENGRERRARSVEFAVTTGPTEPLTGRSGRPVPIFGQPATDLPTELKRQTLKQWDDDYPGEFLRDWIPTLAAVWPHDAEHFLALTCLHVLGSPNWTEAAHDVPRTIDALARHPGRLGPLAAATLAAGISSAQRVHRLHAVDAVLELLPTGRIGAQEVAEVMATYAQAWPATRWAESLAAAAGAPGGAATTVDLLTHLLPRLPHDHRGLNKLLDLLRDELIRQGRRVTDPTLTGWLAGFAGSSAAAKTARSLLAG